MYWFDCDMPNTFVCAGVFNNERDKVGDCMTNYSEFNNLNKYQRRLLIILDEEFDEFAHSMEDCNWNNIADLDIFPSMFIQRCKAVVNFYDRRASKYDIDLPFWPFGSNLDTVLDIIEAASKKHKRSDLKIKERYKYFFDEIAYPWEL